MEAGSCPPRRPRRMRMALAGLWLGIGLAGCASTPAPEGDGSQRVVTRTPSATVWATPEAALAAAAPLAAPARPAAARPVGTAAAPAGAGPVAPPSAAGPARAMATGQATQAAAGPAAPPATAVAAALAQTIHFDFDRFDIKQEFRPLLEGHAQVLAADRSVQLVIEGHADERGGAEYNLALGQKRAHAVLKALALLGAADAQVEAVSFGDTRPVVRGSNEDAWARNRRAEIKRR